MRLTVSSSLNFVGVLVNTNNLGLLEHVVSIYGSMKLVFKVYLWVCFQGSPPLRPSF
jgi:hypothetical protein